MTFFQWRRFNFFDVSKDVDEGALHQSLQGQSPTCFSSGRGHLVVGDGGGFVHFINRQLKVTTVLKAFQREVHLIQQMRQSGLLIAIGEDDPGVNPYLKVYDLDQPDAKAGGSPTLLRVSRVVVPGRVSRPTCLCVAENNSLLAVGFDDGSVLLQRGDVRRERGIRQKKLTDDTSEGIEPVTGLSFRSIGGSVARTLLYVATERSVNAFSLEKDKESRTLLDNLGCEKGLAISAESLEDTHFMTGRPDAVYCYTPEGRGQCYPFEGRKAAMHWFRNYLVVVVCDETATPVDAQEQQSRHTLTVFDVSNKFSAFTAPLKPIKAVLSEWGLLFAISEDNDRLYCLTEKDMQSKLDVLFKRNFYDVAVKVAKAQQCDEEGLVDIFRQYGDHLYAKGNYAEAIENYSKTIGHLEPSYVIRKFLEAHRIHYLTEYLQALHTAGLATGDHTTLLLNCYTKLRDRSRLDDFVLKRSELDFDVDVAIRVCRQSGYTEHALALAEKHGRHEWYLKTRLEDEEGGHAEALKYIAKLGFEQAEANMRTYGAALMRALPKETTELLKRLSTDYHPDNEPLVSEEEMMLEGSSRQKKAANPESFLHLFVNNSDQMVDFLEYMVAERPDEDASIEVHTTLLEHYLHLYSDPEASANFRKAQEEKAMCLLEKNVEAAEDQALILCQRHVFSRGALYLYERKGLFSQILAHHASRGDTAAIISACRRHGSREPELWTQALAHVAREGEATQTQMAEILEAVESLRLLSPLQIVSVLSKSGNASLQLVRDYLIRTVEAKDAQIKEDQAVAEQYAADTDRIRKNNKELKTKAVVFQETKCVACNHPLELPTVHFLCRHSFHEHCFHFQSFSDKEDECPACLPDNKKILDIVNSQQRSRQQHDAFAHQLEAADNSFSVVAEYFGRGLFRDKEIESLESKRNKLAGNLENEVFRAAPAVATEARLRVADPSTKFASRSLVQQSEGRLRAQQGSDAAISGLATSDARLRLNEGSVLKRAPVSSKTAAPASTSRSQQQVRKPPAAGPNPFGDPDEYDDGKNPFSEKSADSAKDSANPFGDPDDEEYDPQLNPFGES